MSDTTIAAMPISSAMSFQFVGFNDLLRGSSMSALGQKLSLSLKRGDSIVSDTSGRSNCCPRAGAVEIREQDEHKHYKNEYDES